MRVCIVGSGFSGTMVAVHLARLAKRPVDITLLERTGRFGAGVAFATSHPAHLLNVPAARMSALPDAPLHFLQWAQARHPSVQPETFVPRQWFSAYLGELLDEASLTATSGSSVRKIDGEAATVERAGPGWVVRTTGGQAVPSDVVVLAIGNFPPTQLPSGTPDFYASPSYVADPWAPDALAIGATDDVLLIGTGLTMIDLVITLHDQGHRGSITAVSRRGLLPQHLRASASVPHEVAPPAALDQWPRTARGLLRGFREAVGAREQAGGDWRDVVASLRAPTPALWASLPLDERRRFLRHVRPYWETRRHGVAPSVGRVVDELRASGRLRVVAGRVRRYEMVDTEVDAQIDHRGGLVSEHVRVHRVINCTSPETHPGRVPSPLVADLARQGRLVTDPLGIGIVTDAHGQLVGADGTPQTDLYLTGPLRRGRTWEHVAVPELRESAQALATYLTEREA